jgi:hypothetical protein
LAVYTPPIQITACELSSNGKFIILALKNSQKLVTLQMKGGDYNDEIHQNDRTYGNIEHDGKSFDLKD